ncbi:MAG: DNA methyltransferase [Caldisericia bacterium]
MSQKDIVVETIKDGPKSIKEIASVTGIVEPNVRRILGMGAKEGVFERIERGVYTLSRNGEDIAVVHTADAVENLPRLVDEGLRADVVFLDLPYTTPAVKGGNRPQKFKVITPDQFGTVMNAIAKMVRTDDSPVYYISSTAPSGQKEMDKYNNKLFAAGFKLVAEGEYVKLQSDGVSISTNPQGKPTSPEKLQLFTKSGMFNEKDLPRNLNFRVIRPAVAGKNGRQAQKPKEMAKSLILQGTRIGEVVADVFAGTGIILATAVELGRKAFGMEIDVDAVNGFIIPRLRTAAGMGNLF